MESVYEYAKWYRDELGLSIVPQLVGTERKLPPAGFPLQEFYNGRRATDEELREWFEKNQYNIAAIVGSASNSLCYWDIDDISTLEKLKMNQQKFLDNARKMTFVNKTSRGYGVMFRDSLCPAGIGNIDFRAKEGVSFDMELLTQNHLVTLPPSKHFSGIIYQNIGQPAIAVRPSFVNDILDQAKHEGWLGSIGKRLTSEDYRRMLRNGVPKGSTRVSGFKLARYLLWKWELDVDTAWDEMQKWNEKNELPMKPAELKSQFEWALKYTASSQHEDDSIRLPRRKEFSYD